MNHSEPDPSSEVETHKPSPARKATGLILVPYFFGALAMWPGFPFKWNVLGVKLGLILALPFFLILRLPKASSPVNDKWQWPHFFATLVYLILASLLMFHKPVLLGCAWSVCF